MIYECNLGDLAKDLIGHVKETSWNKEALDAWKEVATSENVNELYNTPDNIE